MFAATTQANSTLIIGIMLGGGLVGFVWLIVAMSLASRDNYHVYHSTTVTYDTRKANRIIGYMGERMTSKTQWVMWCCSLWRCHAVKHDPNCYFFTLSIDELEPAKITPVTWEQAQKFIRAHAADATDAEKLIRDWMPDKKP